jgi:hypothetical protein
MSEEINTNPTLDPEEQNEWEGLQDELRVTAESWAQTFGKAFENLTGLMVIRTDSDLRQKLDLLVESGAVKSRAEALKVLYEAGMDKKRKIFEKAETTKAQVEALKAQLRGLAGNGSSSS